MPAKKILFVYTRGGAPLEYAFPQIARQGELHVLALTELPARTRHLWEKNCVDIVDRHTDVPDDEKMVDVIVEHAERIRADAVMCLSEFSVLAVAQACERLGMPGPGLNATRSRDKRLMRAVWRDAGVPSPRFRQVTSQDDLASALTELATPFLLKSAFGAGSIGQLVISDGADVADAWAASQDAVAKASRSGFMELGDRHAGQQFLVEEIIQGSTRTWFDDDAGYGDYLSVEGIVAGGVYHPICITTRIPTIPPFTELSNLAPCSMPEELQRKIEAVARKAVDALELDTCGTHTEMKLADNGEVYLIESAARLGGVMVASEVETVFGYDLIGMLTREHLGEPVEYPERMLVSGSRAAGSLSIIATDAAGNPWSSDLVWDFESVDWSVLLSSGSSIEAVPGLSVPNGTPMPRYNESGGSTNYAGIFFLQARDAETLVKDAYSVLNGLESALKNGQK